MAMEFSVGSLDVGDSYDVVIIGGGPAGLSAAIYAARAKLSTLVLDKGAVSGALGMASRIDNYPGVPQSMAGRDLLSAFRGQAEVFGAETVRAQVIGVDFERWPKEVITAERVYLGRSVIIATGAMGRKPVLEGEARLIGRGVSYCAACDAAFYADEDVAMAWQGRWTPRGTGFCGQVCPEGFRLCLH